MPALNSAVGDGHRIVVITHDCDLPNEGETSVEVIVADVVSASNPQFSYAKNPRRLHLGYESAMSSLIVRNVDDAVIKALEARAARHGRSVEAEHRALLADAPLNIRRRSLVRALAAMPDVGEDADFARLPAGSSA